MKRFFVYTLPLLLMLVLAACGGLNNKPKIDSQSLIGRWQAPSQSSVDPIGDNPMLVFVFRSDTCIVNGTGYGYWGYQFDEGDGTLEDDVLKDFHGNGWFGWTPKTGAIVLVNMFNVGNPKSPVTNEVTAFSSTSMTMKDTDKTYNFTKVGSK